MKNTRFLIGTDLFSKHRLNGGYFVDKSLFIADVIDGDDVVLIPRPRRFGKTLNLTMLKAFFEMGEPKNRDLFRGLKIEQNSDSMTHLGQHPTLFISLKDIRAENWDVAREMLAEAISKLVKKHRALWQKSEDATEREMFLALAEKRASSAERQRSLSSLCKVLYEVTGKPAVLLIDEYDTPVIEARVKGYQSEMLEFLKSWLGSALKPSEPEILYRAVVTGILRIARESLFSELNNLDVSTLLTPGRNHYSQG
ncbi:MAG: AAA family ATPase [Planctomycetes bacterium]|nr:AAA family ATPase [Planctomycetota bacterium]